MSRIGKVPVSIPEGVSVAIADGEVRVRGPRGELVFLPPPEVEVACSDGEITVAPRSGSKRARQMWGMSRARIGNIVTGVTQGFERVLNITGVGYRAQMDGSNLKLALGFSHDIVFEPPAGVTIETPRPIEIRVSGIDAVAVGQAAANIRAFRPPEPYKGKGVALRGEWIYRKTPRKAQSGG